MVPAINESSWSGNSATNNTRGNVCNETFLNENEQDANSVLTELDKGLRSCKLCIQCEAIVRFPKLFEKYPFPILINSSFLKLAEFFLNGSNLLRFWVLRVCQQSESHLDKILNIDAFVKRIFIVMHSNDPVARALTLRTLGAVSRLIPEKKQVHHALRRALDSHDRLEVEAAICASAQFALQSRTFAIGMCSKVSDMIESLQTPVPMKLELIPVLRYMHHDANAASLVRKLCSQLLPKYPAESFIVEVLVSLSELSAQTITEIAEQVRFLIPFMKDTRKTVRLQALRSLKTLADVQCVHVWHDGTLKDIVDIACNCYDNTEQYLLLNVIYKVCNNPLDCQKFLAENNNECIMNLCSEWIQSNSYRISKETFTVLATIATNIEQSLYDCCFESTLQLIDDNFFALLMTTLYYECSTSNLRKIILCSMRVAKTRLSFAIELAMELCILLKKFEIYPISIAKLICEAFATLCSLFQLKKFTSMKEEIDNTLAHHGYHKNIKKATKKDECVILLKNYYKLANTILAENLFLLKVIFIFTYINAFNYKRNISY